MQKNLGIFNNIFFTTMHALICQLPNTINPTYFTACSTEEIHTLTMNQLKCKHLHNTTLNTLTNNYKKEVNFKNKLLLWIISIFMCFLSK